MLACAHHSDRVRYAALMLMLALAAALLLGAVMKAGDINWEAFGLRHHTLPD